MTTFDLELIKCGGGVYKTAPLPAVADGDNLAMHLPSGDTAEGIAQFLGCWSTSDGVATGNPYTSFSTLTIDVKNHVLTWGGMIGVTAGDVFTLILHRIGL
jgi:hypothetical protein